MISPLAYVDASAKIGENVKIYPFAYIDKNVEIGDDCEIMPYVSIMSGARLGKRNRIFQGAVIAAEPQDFAYKGGDTLAVIGDDNTIRENVVINRASKAYRSKR
jgi:acyl-[acyl carrier protein]--UDP-N-acetylglucosamine O-acyltransferase